MNMVRLDEVTDCRLDELAAYRRETCHLVHTKQGIVAEAVTKLHAQMQRQRRREEVMTMQDQC